MIYLAFTLGLLAGSVLTFIFLSLLMRQLQTVARQQIADNNDRSIELLAERNKLSLRQLELMEKGHPDAVEFERQTSALKQRLGDWDNICSELWRRGYGQLDRPANETPYGSVLRLIEQGTPIPEEKGGAA